MGGAACCVGVSIFLNYFLVFCLKIYAEGANKHYWWQCVQIDFSMCNVTDRVESMVFSYKHFIIYVEKT